MCSGKRSPGIRKGLFLTCDKTLDGGKGEPSKTGVHSTFFIVPPYSTSFHRGTG